MRDIPKGFIEPLRDFLEWHLKKYPRTSLPEGEGSIRLEHLLDGTYESKPVISGGTIYFLKKAICDAIDMVDCGVDEEKLLEIKNWLEQNQ